MINRSNENNYHWDYREYQGGYGQSPNRGKKNSRGLRVFLVMMGVVVLLVGALCVGAAVWGNNHTTPQPNPDPSIGNDQLEHLPEIDQQSKPDDSVPEQTEDGLLTPAGIYKKCAPSVVGVVTYGSSSVSQGSGIVLSADGYIITNAHVISGGEKFEVVLQNGDTYTAAVLGADSQSDLAILRLQDPPAGLVAATFGNSDELEVGEMVAAIGNPGGLALASTQTVGYVSAVKRTITTELGYTMVCIQADVAISPGNSGGPLINSYGQVVGITSSKLVEEGYEGISFFIPINTALPILDDLMQHGRVTGRALLGVTATEVSSSEAAYYGIPRGLRIVTINEDSDMGRKGAEVGDIITSIGGEAITGRADCSDILAKYQPGDTVEIGLYRASRTGRGQTFTITVTLLGS